MTFLYQPPSTFACLLLYSFLFILSTYLTYLLFSISLSLFLIPTLLNSQTCPKAHTTSWIKLLIFISQLVLLFESPRLVLSDDTPPDCPYPCLPPPSSFSAGYPPPPPSQGIPSFGYYPPPSGYVPYLSPPFVNLQAPPPPNPILPWFPFYYRSPPSPNSSPSLLSHHASTFMILLIVFPCCFLLLV
ncbi:pectinesterase inhibitor 10-like [Dioscorea cayenensis subsp. rotundata]|uniref:Pectinesterase inhibitor 10-like n=1 Tax=Dioscorea cayennensis subsp. rotundata TaxID=55577 RepID=A0AB40B444_DIOCR|nr:pectinesterase inhibitor 10-like [Dioscorea cayenensis subsp. rotundata]